jgi:hypothetical protein
MLDKKVTDYVLLRRNKMWTGYAEMFYDVENFQKKFVGSGKNRRKWPWPERALKGSRKGRSITGLQELEASMSIRACTM